MTTDPRVKNLRDAQRRLRSALVANADRLDKPFTDDPDKNPWDTFVRPAMRGLEAAVDEIAAMPAAPVAVPPADRAGLRELIADAIRSAACPGDCGKTEEECARERIQPFVWHHGRLAAVEGSPEQFADAVLAVLPAPVDRGAVLREAAELRRLAAETRQAPCGRPASLTTPCSAGDHCCEGPAAASTGAQTGEEA